MRQRRRLQVAHLSSAVFISEVFVHSSKCPADGRVEMVLDCVIGSAGELGCDFFPSVSKGEVCGEESGFFGGGPGGFEDHGGEMIVPS